MQRDTKNINSIDVERSELRYIFYTHDFHHLIADFMDLGFRKEAHESTPCTRTVYFGSKIGLKPGLSIKARIYSLHRTQNVWHIEPDTLFNLLEVKNTVNLRERAAITMRMEEDQLNHAFMMDSHFRQVARDIIIRIQRATEDGILKDSTFKSKSRLKKSDLIEDPSSTQLSLNDIVTVLTKPGVLDDNLSPKLLGILNGKIRPIYRYSLIPYLMTQYTRLHMIPVNEDWLGGIRVTVDPGVEYYNILLHDTDDFMEHHSAIAEFMKREKFCRLEFKINPTFLESQPELDAGISKILQRYGCLAYLSKKWAGVTLVSDRHIKKQAFWRESMEKRISGFFPVDQSWFDYNIIIGELKRIINDSSNFSTYETQPRMLVKNENYVTGYLGVPVPSLVVRVEGPNIKYHLPPESYPIFLSRNEPDFFILEEWIQPVRSTLISSKAELDNILHPSIEIEAHSFFRSYGFLVQCNQSQRVYKLTIERKTDVTKYESSSKIYCKMRYIGSKERLHKSSILDMYKELQVFYGEFAGVLSQPVE
ncbi:hypothetical protein GF325_03510 [Candidatus Bathyarchaeota archaeon]|nr:hypothetical protein [Candidatus Bathyarchaeota archaeon]